MNLLNDLINVDKLKDRLWDITLMAGPHDHDEDEELGDYYDDPIVMERFNATAETLIEQLKAELLY